MKRMKNSGTRLKMMSETIAVAIFRLNDLGQLEVVAALAVFMLAVILAVSLALNWLAGRYGSRVATELPVP